MRKKYVMILVVTIMFCICFIPNSVYAANVNADTRGNITLNGIISSANNFFGNSIMQKGSGFINLTGLFNDVINIIFTIGNLIILCAAAFMGLRYVWSGVQEKASIKESAINMSVGVIFFYMARGIYTVCSAIVRGIIVHDGNNFVDGFGEISTNIWSNVAYVVKILALLGFVTMGIKYMLTSADTKADIKRQLFPVIAGLLVIFVMTDIISLITDVSKDVLNVSANGVNQVQNITIDDDAVDDTVTDVMQSLYANAALIFQFLAVGIVVFTGLRYMLSSADTRADIKGQTIILIAGAIMVFGAMEIIKLVQNVGQDIL